MAKYAKRKIYRKKRKTTKVSKTVKRYVKHAIAINQENKMQLASESNRPIYNIINDTTIRTLLPNIAQSTGQGDRVGNTIRVKYLRLCLRYRVDQTALPPPAPSFPYIPKYTDIYIFKSKLNNFTPPNAAQMAQFLNNGSGNVDYAGRLVDGMRTINTEYFTLCKHIRRMNVNSQTVNNFSGLDPYPAAVELNYNLTKYVKKIFRFNDTAGQVTNDNLYIAIAMTDIDTIGSPIPGIQQGSWTYLSEITYEDA